jgi:hypothetical protein
MINSLWHEKGAVADTKQSEVLSSSHQLARASDALPARNYCSFIIALNPESEMRSTKHVHKTSHLHNLHCYSCPVRPRQLNSFASAQPCPALVCSGCCASDSRSACLSAKRLLESRIRHLKLLLLKQSGPGWLFRKLSRCNLKLKAKVYLRSKLLEEHNPRS